jgi:hypothetical protein
MARIRGIVVRGDSALRKRLTRDGGFLYIVIFGALCYFSLAFFGMGSLTSIVSRRAVLRLLGLPRSISVDRHRSNILPISCSPFSPSPSPTSCSASSASSSAIRMIQHLRIPSSSSGLLRLVRQNAGHDITIRTF